MPRRRVAGRAGVAGPARGRRRPRMLAAAKDTVVAELKQQSLQLRQLELEYYVKRYTNIATQSIILAGFAYDSLVEITISNEWLLHRPAVVSVYYIASSLTMVLALYTSCVSSFCCVYGHRLALLGPLGSVDRAVAVMMMQRTTIFVTYGLALFCLVLAGVTMSWVKMDGTGQGEIPGAITGVFALFIFGVLWKKEAMKNWFSIPMEEMTQGNVRLGLGANDLVRRSHRPSLLNAAPDVLRPRRVAGGVAPRGGGGFSRHRLLPRCVPVATPRPCRLHTHARALRPSSPSATARTGSPSPRPHVWSGTSSAPGAAASQGGRRSPPSPPSPPRSAARGWSTCSTPSG